ncbi:MAG: putative aminohydrolase SsnA [Spirochaetaceae bacterium]
MILLKNATIVQFEPPLVRKGMDIAIEETLIKEVGINLENRYKAERVIDLAGEIIYPGLVCSHNHFYSGLARGIMAKIKPSTDFISILQNLWWRLDRAIDEEILLYSGLICSLDAIKSGTTAVIDHHSSPSYIQGSLNTLKEGFLKTGLRGLTCYEVTDRNGLEQMKDGIEENINFAKAIDADKKDPRKPYLVEALIGGHAPFTIPDEGLSLLAEAMEKTGRGIHIHVAEDLYDNFYSHDKYSKNVLSRLDDFGLLNSKSIVVHGVHLEEEDIKILNDKDCFLVHTPRSNMNNAVGYNNKLDKINNLALGTDGIGSNMFEEFKFAYFKHKDNRGPMWPDSYLKFLNNGNRLLERNFEAKFGKIEAGYKADLVISDYNSPTPLLAENIPGHMAFGMSSHDVKTVIINGKIVYEDRQFPFDVKEIYEKATKATERLWEKMDNLKN